MKKFLSLELAIAFFMCTIAFYFGGIYFNFNFNNHFQSAVNIVSTQSQKIPNADLTYADLTSTDAKQIDVLFFCYNEDKTNPEKNPSLGSSNELLTNIQTSLASFSQYIKTASYNNAKVEFNFVSTATNTSPDDDGTPLILSIDKPATINKASLFSAVMNELEDFTGSGTKEDYLNIALTQSLHNSGNDMILIYLDYKSYLGMPKEDAQTRYNENTSGVFSLDYSINTQDSTKFFIKSHYSGALSNNDIYGTSTDIDNYFLIHSDALTSFLITQNAEPDFFNLVSSKFTKMMLSMYGLPNLAFNNGQGNDYDTTYAGNHSILSNGTYFATFNPYYAYLLGQEIDNARGWLPATFTITEIKKETEITFERDGQDIYYIAPEDYPDQRIVIYYANTSEYNQWTFKEGQSTPPTDGYVIVARVQTQKNQDGSLASASNTYTPFYVFEPSSINGELTQRSSTLENARLANVGDVIGFTELGVNGTATTPYTGYVSFEKNVGGITNYINSTLKFSLTEKDANGIKVKVECNNSDFLLPENVAVKQALNDVVNLSTDVKIYLYNHYIEKNGQAILNNEEDSIIIPNNITSIGDMKYALHCDTPYEDWLEFYDPGMAQWRYDIFNSISTYDFNDLTTLDLYGMRDIQSLEFLQEINLNSVRKLCLTGTDLSQGHKPKNQSVTSLEYITVLDNLEILELNSCQIEDISFLRSYEQYSNLKQISLMDNNLTDISPINGEYLINLQYVNVHYNQLTNERLQLTYRASTTNFYNSTAIDVGIQRFPYSQFITEKNNFIFKIWTNSSFTNILTTNPLKYSKTFNTQDSSASYIYAHDPNGTSTDGNIISGGIRLFDFEHGQYELAEIEYYSLVSDNFGIDAITRTLTPKYLNCYYVEFEFDEEEVCQTPSTELYLTTLGAYDNLNPLINYHESHFETFGYVIRMEKVSEDLTEEVSSIDLSQAGEYRISYTFKFDENEKTDTFKLPNSYVLGDIVVTKTLKVLEYKKIEFEESTTPLANKIIDPILYKSLLYLSGKVGTIDEAAGIDKAKLGIESAYTLYNQDFYFFKVANKHIPSILEKRLNPAENSNEEKGVLTSLNISNTAQEIIRKIKNINKNGELPEDIMNSISGIHFMNLQSIEDINLNALGLSSINEILNGQSLPRLKILNAGGNKITSITDISTLKTLEYVDLSFNQISDPTPLKQLTDPSYLTSQGYSTQTLKKVNLAFNNICIKGNERMNSTGTSEYAGGNDRNKFLLDDQIPADSKFIPQNEIYIILVQMLVNFDHYVNSSKWEYYYTPALKVGNGEIYTVKYGRNNSTPSISVNNFSNSKGHTNYLTDAGNYAINFTLSTDLANRNGIPFKAYTRTLYFTISKASLVTLEKSYGSSFPGDLLLHTDSSHTSNRLLYTMLTTEYQEFLNNLKEDNPDAYFGARKNDIELRTSSSNWIYNAITGSGYNFFDDQTDGEPIRISAETDDNSNNPNVNNMYIQLRYELFFYRTDTRTKQDQFMQSKVQHSDKAVVFIRIELVNNPAVSFKDENLKEVLLLQLNKTEENAEIYAHDFYNIEELDLSNAGITTFEIADGADDSLVYGFEDIIFKKITKINLSNNNITNTDATDLDPLRRLFLNTSIFPSNVTSSHTLEYFDLSYNKLTSLVPLNERLLFQRDITLNLFGNIIDFANTSNLDIIGNPDFTDGTRTPCKVFIGIQGLGSSSLQKLISFKKSIYSSDDTFAKFVVYGGNFYIGINDVSYQFDGAEVEYRDVNNQIVLSQSDSLFTIYYYKDTYYRENQNYPVYYSFAYGDYINIELTATIIHQKLYFETIIDEYGDEVEINYVHKEFHNDYDLDAFNEYNQAILNEDIFVYENCTREDFNLDSWILYDAYDKNLEGVLYSNQLTGDYPYRQRYSIMHLDSELFRDFDKMIYIVDSTAPIIQTNSPDSRDKYVVLRGSTYAPYYANKIDKDLVFIDDYDNYYFKENINPIIRVTIRKDGEIISEVEGFWNDAKSGLSINCNNPGKYQITYVAVDSNGNVSQPYERTVEVYYQPYSYIKITDFSAMFSAGKTKMTASVYKTEEDVNRNTNPIFYWYVDGNFAGTSFIVPDTNAKSSLSTSIELYIEGAGTHTVQVFIDITKEAYEENVALGIAGSLASATKSTSVFILMDNQVLIATLIGIGILILIIIIIVIIIVALKRKREARRNDYRYTIIKHDK